EVGLLAEGEDLDGVGPSRGLYDPPRPVERYALPAADIRPVVEILGRQVCDPPSLHGLSSIDRCSQTPVPPRGRPWTCPDRAWPPVRSHAANSLRLCPIQSSSRDTPSRVETVGFQPSKRSALRMSAMKTRWSPGRQSAYEGRNGRPIDRWSSAT